MNDPKTEATQGAGERSSSTDLLDDLFAEIRKYADDHGYDGREIWKFFWDGCENCGAEDFPYPPSSTSNIDKRRCAGE